MANIQINNRTVVFISSICIAYAPIVNYIQSCVVNPLYLRVTVPIAVDLEFFESVCVFELEGVEISQKSMISNFSNIKFVSAIVSELLNLAFLELFVLALFIDYSDSLSVLMYKNVLIFSYLEQVPVTGREVSF